MSKIMSVKANIFDIQRFSVHDGEGVRTTIFFKGCSQKCIWCHNPEGISFENNLIYSKSKCVNCRICERLSDGKVFFDNRNNIIIDRNALSEEEKHLLEEQCPTGALRVDGRTISLNDAFNEIIKDKAFYKYGGGFTASGGECLLQADFLECLLKKLKEIDISTAIETSLCVPLSNVKKVIDYLDIIYIDIKLIDEQDHKKYVSENLDLILDNARYVLISKQKDKVIVRTPLIPGITDDDDNIAKISKFISEIYPNVKYELLNYNYLAGLKYEQIGLAYTLNDLKPLDDIRIKELIKVAKSNGVKNIIFKEEI